eukprot:TRINITY_DN9780_c1_g1_i1.p1 TRINITY_DN9780_c1_g1~~TRINITY_DN9780_c1_g1_i1.p1  ORF type:complete len:469 (-),score=137.41 TRINITY_DN9780_c1_g1_i1:59-1465(-)
MAKRVLKKKKPKAPSNPEPEEKKEDVKVQLGDDEPRTKKRKVGKNKLAKTSPVAETSDNPTPVVSKKRKTATAKEKEAPPEAPPKKKKKKLAGEEGDKKVTKKKLVKKGTKKKKGGAAMKEIGESDDDSFWGDGADKAQDPYQHLAVKADRQNVSDDYKAFVGNLVASLGEAEVRKFLSKCGNIERFDMPEAKPGKPARHAFVYFETESGVEAAMKLDGSEFHGRELQVKRAVAGTKNKKLETRSAERAEKDRLTVFLAGLDFGLDEEKISKDFSECGEVETVRMLRRDDGTFKGTAFVCFKKENSVRKAIEWNGQYYGERRIIVRRTGENADDGKGKGKKGKAGKGADKGKGKGQEGNGWNADHNRTAFVGSLNTSMTEDQIRSDFEECGPIESFRMLKKDGEFTGAVFIVFSTQEGFKKALEWNGQNYNGHRIKVNGVNSKDRDDKGKGKGKGKAKGDKPKLKYVE